MICKISFINKHGYPEHCVEEAAFADYDEKIANEEAWAKTLCRRHYILAKAKPSGNWVSYPEHGTVTTPKEKQMDYEINPEGPFKSYTLNEEGVRKMRSLKVAFSELLNLVVSTARPDPRHALPTVQDPMGTGWPPINTEDMRQVILKLQEASFFATHAVALLPENQS
jgi:hypothetical protein